MNIDLNISVASLSTGIHDLFIRFKDANGKWGLHEGRPFYVMSSGTFGSAVNIVSAEYFFDTDPGVGNGTAITVAIPADSVNLALNLNVASLSTGIHNLFIRFKDANGKWGLHEGRPFYVMSSGTFGFAANIVSAEYFFDTDPGVGNGTAITVTTPSDSVNILVDLSVAGLDTGTHNLFVRFIDDQGMWGLYEGGEFSICAPATANISQTICANDSIFLQGNWQDTAGTYFDTLISSTNCDSIITTTLTINPVTTGSQTLTICANDSVIVGTSVYNTTGVFTDVLTASNGCDSTFTTNLTVTPAITGSQTLTICAEDSVIVGTSVYNTTGVFTDIFTASNGCDSTFTTNLTVTPATTGSQTLTICTGDSVIVGTSVYNSTGIFTDIFTASNGCDSTFTTNLTVSAITGSQTLTICAGDSIVVGTSIYDSTGVYTNIFTASNGCDSTFTTNLTVNDLPTVSFTGLDTNYCLTGVPLQPLQAHPQVVHSAAQASAATSSTPLMQTQEHTRSPTLILMEVTVQTTYPKT